MAHRFLRPGLPSGETQQGTPETRDLPPVSLSRCASVLGTFSNRPRVTINLVPESLPM